MRPRPPPAPTHHHTTHGVPHPHLAEHDPTVFGGYKGCVGENGLLPCAQDGFEGLNAMTALKKPLVWNQTTMTCDATAYTMYTETFWVLWGHPQDTYELTKRTRGPPRS